MTTIKQAELNGQIMRIIVDESPESPREWDNLGKMVCWHRRYSLGDKHDFTIEEFHKRMENNLMVLLPLYLYDHSGISMSTNRDYPFNCRWDSGKVGYIYADCETIRKEFNVKRVSTKLVKRVKKILLQEVETYDLYLRGQVFGYSIVKLVKCETCGNVEEEDVDSCWGFYGSDFEKNGIFEHVDKKWRTAEWKEIE